ncbi:PREDICTED: uncharacterized protein LOC109193611 [Ipomoea nil]|uniref:uncharacterized protein LOC109193611 n=1 Tax=Ipomoea nil TaxID=35883 RepID=UPI000901BE43|nr:PREDICTED: uncharacterized protein LOC109193611 [Ipomoea nil]
MNIITWNYQGAVSQSFHRSLKYLIQVFSPSILCLFEPKVSGFQANSICSNFGFNDWLRIEVVGFSGGIWIFWNNNCSLDICYTHPQFVLMQVHEAYSPQWSFAAVYGIPNITLRRKLFNELTRLNMNIRGPWLVAGDFNSVCSPDETSNPDNWQNTRCADFTDWIFNEGLVDLGFSGAKFTWMRGLNQQTFKGARLDRGLCSVDWKTAFADSLVEHLPMLSSDHSPILIKTSSSPSFPRLRPFRFNMAWSSHQLFQPFVHDKQLYAFEVFWMKLESMRAKYEAMEMDATLPKESRVVLSMVLVILADNCRPELLKLDRNLRKELEEILHQEELLWFQRSREEWIVSGDRNTHFYHVATSVKNSSLKVKRLRDDSGIWITDETALRDHIRRYFGDLFTTDQSHSATLPRGRYPIIHEDVWREVNKTFSLEEIKQALFDMSPCKAPGPDGFSAGSYQQAWQTVGDSIIAYAKEFFENGILTEGSNDTVITLIPKTSNPETVRQLRPIGFCNVTYKVLTKAMTSRLKDILQKLVGQYQTSFVPGRQITDNILVYQEQAVLQRTGIPRVDDMGKYLGVPSIHGRLKKDSFAGMIDKMRNCLAGWKSKSLSLAGRHVLVQSVLSTIPFYTMQTTLIPKGVISSMERLIRSFLWGAKEGERKCNLVNWYTVTSNKDFGGLGIRRLEEMNISFLAKLGWRLMTEEDSFFARVFRTKYAVPISNPSQWRPKQNMLNAWKCILKSVPAILAGSKHLVRNGKGTLFWQDIWIGDRSLRDVASPQIPDSISQLKVSDYWSNIDGWKWDDFEDFLPSAITDAMAAILICPDDHMQDQIIWSGETSGLLSVSSAYNIITETPNVTNDPTWGKIWKLKLPSRIRIFLWLAKHNRAMTNTVRARKGFTSNDRCWACPNEAEDIEHVLRKCPKAQAVWENILPELAPSRNSLPFAEWLTQGLTDSNGGRSPSISANLFATSVWWIGRWRNEAIFNNQEISLNSKISWILTQHKEITTAFARASHPVGSSNAAAWKQLTWSKPQENYIKINVDGSMHPQNSMAGCGGVARDSSGEWIGGFTSNIGRYHPLMAEVWAVLREIELAKSLDLHQVIFESDSKAIVDGITTNSLANSFVCNFLATCRRELQGIRDWRIAWVPREQNGTADALARMAISRPRGVPVLSHPPVDIIPFLYYDCNSFAVWRFSSL